MEWQWKILSIESYREIERRMKCITVEEGERKAMLNLY